VWELRWGKYITTLLEIQRTTGNTPRALRDRPALRAPYRHLLEAFYELSAGRSYGEVPQPLTLSDIRAYCEMFGISALPERERFFRAIRHLDVVYLREVTRKAKP
jgi:hypothetical protein